VAAGDWIVPSGLDDGTGVALDPQGMTEDQYALVVGQAWDHAADEGVKWVRVVVGLSGHEPSALALARQVQALQLQLAEMAARLATLEAALAQ
jgi:hypothetical protein